MYLRELIAVIMKRNNGCNETLQWFVLQAELNPGSARLLEQGKGPGAGDMNWCRSAGWEMFPCRCTQCLPAHRFQSTKRFSASPICFFDSFMIISGFVFWSNCWEMGAFPFLLYLDLFTQQESFYICDFR